jgi:hypothetical protein
MMADDLDGSENQQPAADQPQNTSGSSKSSLFRRLNLSRFNPKFGIPRFSFLKSKSDKPKSPAKKISFLWLWLLIIVISYAFVGYFLSILLTMPSRKNLAIAGFAIAALLPTITAFADYGLMKWGYLLSGLLIVGGLFYLANIKFHFIFLAIMLWTGIITIAFVGDALVKQNRKFLITIAILTIPCLVGLGLGWQIWRLVASMWS